jgi:superfamily II DNA or RNA helicase
MTMMADDKNVVVGVIDRVLRLKRDTLGPQLLSDLRNRLTRNNPAFMMMQRMREKNPAKYRYVSMPPATITSIAEDADTVMIPRGFKNEFLELAERHNHTVKFFDETIAFDRDPAIALSGELELKRYQRRGLSTMVMKSCGILIAPCGGGKTVTGIAIITTLKQPTLVLVHTNDLLTQWCEELRIKASLPSVPGQWAGGARQRETVTVATIQTLIRMPVPKLVEFLDHFGCVILDEAHHCPADTFMSVMNLCAARYRFGLTATPKRKDGLEFLMFDTIGPIVAEITDSDLAGEGRSQSCIVHEVFTTFYTRHTADQWTYLLSELIADKDRNNLIVKNVLSDWKGGQFPLVITDRVSHCYALRDMLAANGMSASVLAGDVDKLARKRIVDDARLGRIDAIIATKVADEGLDIPNLSSIHMVSPTSNEARVQQRIGRIRRPVEGKVSRVYDYVDSRVSCCSRMAQDRRRLYKRWNFTFEQPPRREI